jgi:hypothetical protein
MRRAPINSCRVIGRRSFDRRSNLHRVDGLLCPAKSGTRNDIIKKGRTHRSTPTVVGRGDLAPTKHKDKTHAMRLYEFTSDLPLPGSPAPSSLYSFLYLH